MIQIDDKIISLDLFEKRFVCDLGACKGACCVEGESGAPLETEETKILEDIYPLVEPYLTPEAIEQIKLQGKWVIDSDGDNVTPIINGNECAYAYFDDNGTCKCAIEKAFYEGKVSFKKPISCHLYPIRTQRFTEFEAINYHQWQVCAPARTCGKKLGVRVYKFLKEPIIRKYGEAFYQQMEEIEIELKGNNVIE